MKIKPLTNFVDVLRSMRRNFDAAFLAAMVIATAIFVGLIAVISPGARDGGTFATLGVLATVLVVHVIVFAWRRRSHEKQLCREVSLYLAEHNSIDQ